MSKGLLTLQTDLKSLRYGNDKPYVTKDINDAPSSNQTGMLATKRVDDLSRIAQMLIDRPGLKHLGNEALLRQVGVQDRLAKSRKSGKSIAGSILKELGGTALATVKVVGSTLAQVPVNGTGTHFLRGFRTDTYLQPVNGNQFSQFAQFFGAGGIEGAPFALRGEEVPGEAVSNFGTKVSNTEFKVELGSKYDYDEYFNTPTGSNQAKINAENGAPIKVGTYETTPSTGSLGISNKNIEGDVTQLEQPDIKPFKEEDQVVKTKGTTKDNVGNAQAGSAITLQGKQFETTAQRFELGRSNQLTEADEPELLPDNGNDGNKRYSSDSTYTGRTSADNIGSVLSGKSIFSSIEGQDYTYHNETPYGQTAIAGNYPTGSAPREVSLEKLRQEVNSGTVDIVTEDFTKTSIQDFRKGSTSSYSFDYNQSNVKRETRVGLGSQGRKGKVKTNYMLTNALDIDKLNATDVSDRLDGTDDVRDMAKFYFEIITPEGSKFLYFRAFLENIDDGYTADWKGHKYVGRAENFYTYGGFDRDINVSFKIAAATRVEMKPLYRKMVYLASSTAPTYSTSGLMRGTLARMTIGSYLDQIPGVITSVKFTIDNETPWEIALANPDGGSGNSTDDDMQELPMVINCSVSFKPIHDFAPQTGLYHYTTLKSSTNGSKSFF